MGTGQQARPAMGRRSFWRRHRRLAWVGGGILVACLVTLGATAILLHQVEPFLKARIVSALQDHFHARVELDSFHVSLVHGIRAEGKGLRIWPPAVAHGVTLPEAAGPQEPLISLEEFRFHAPLRLRPGGPVHIPAVYLKGLQISLPPRSHFEHVAGQGAAQAKPTQEKKFINFEIGVLQCDGANLVLGTSKPGKLPLDFKISHFKVTDILPDGTMNVEVELINPRPVGLIYSRARVGPWRTDDPGETPITGNFHFDHADLGTFKGIAGILNSTGSYQGTLRDLTVDGQTETPDFRLTKFNTPVNLYTRYHAKVDGTNGDTWLEPVEATLGHSHFLVQGEVVRVRVPAESDDNGSGKQKTIGHNIDLNIDIEKGKIDDFMRLASHSPTPMLTGDVHVKAVLHIGPGKEPVPDRMQLKGHFQLDQAQFTSPKIQDRIEDLSLRSQGRPKDAKNGDPDSVRSQMEGDFRMANGTIKLPALEYTIPGANIHLHGTYGVEGGQLEFHGTVRTEASISKMVGGWKGFLLKPVDPLFKKDGAGSEIPIHVKGTRESPEFGLDFKGTKKTSPERPGEKQ